MAPDRCQETLYYVTDAAGQQVVLFASSKPFSAYSDTFDKGHNMSLRRVRT